MNDNDIVLIPAVCEKCDKPHRLVDRTSLVVCNLWPHDSVKPCGGRVVPVQDADAALDQAVIDRAKHLLPSKPRRTLIVNLWGGPGTGKSTTAAMLFALLKQAGVNSELAREYVKKWAWQGRVPGPMDQFIIMGKQTQEEAVLYGKVDVVVTDSPVMLSAFYAQKYNSPIVADGITHAVKSFYEAAMEAGHRHMNVVLERSKPYQPAGRFQTETEARALDDEMVDFLTANSRSMPFLYPTDEAGVKRLASQVLDIRRRMEAMA